VSAIVLSIGTTHPWNVAGVGRDIAVGSALGARVFTAVAAVSAQDGSGVVALSAVSTDIFEAQLRVLPWESAGAVRIGALPNAAAVRAAAAFLRERPWLPAVVDPVFAASRGGALADDAAYAAVRDELAVLSSVILTPNVEEAGRLLERPRVERADLADAARRLRERGAAAVLVTGGDLLGDPADALAWAQGVEIFNDSRIAGEMHGTGCTLAMAMACELAAGRTPTDAVRAARTFVRLELARH